ncbi:CPBP family intramembrane glutamic endopeptidase [Mycobacteroides chelonae]|jgi:membrane protease YdiL (CAAX protease family)|uniref:CAAX protease family protein n=1 Tax=Mycobacteroides chelonae TaxID=1774 RepID=A0AB73MGL3_MYCCH|nr:CPBP family intramembrane glutamic endopeptidase [Mycobacteroides chelonae]MBF9328710.1 CPBP family intramembrane metalloprotease [Mycobacteroides chelonae]MBF9423512.1 CPBP family intramembrane metalloprotease [Mycobacteroides chelonae]MBF9434395.1 CPBP family intramembrane metalloprotease [Mycobacteroides chelonae]MBV6358412.1 CPBP family intramembrane metalloprotease [Mycobacteroides chelonae]MEC4835939.1 CPBP family intramembrane glutamic endopeptidase [Mycobacteroides chelonae]
MSAVAESDMSARTIRIEMGIVLAISFGMSAVSALLQFTSAVIAGLSGQTVALNPRRAELSLIDLGLNLVSITRLIAWGALAVYLLWRSGFGPSSIGLARWRSRTDGLGALGLAALIGLPGLALYVGARWMGLSVQVIPASLDDTWWRIPVLVLSAFANGWAEEVVVVAYLQTRLRQLGYGTATTIAYSALLRGCYHLYQGVSAGIGNLVMGLVFGYVWQRTGRLWPLVVAHGVIDTVAFVGFALLRDHLSWLH